MAGNRERGCHIRAGDLARAAKRSASAWPRRHLKGRIVETRFTELVTGNGAWKFRSRRYQQSAKSWDPAFRRVQCCWRTSSTKRGQDRAPRRSASRFDRRARSARQSGAPQHGARPSRLLMASPVRLLIGSPECWFECPTGQTDLCLRPGGRSGLPASPRWHPDP